MKVLLLEHLLKQLGATAYGVYGPEVIGGVVTLVGRSRCLTVAHVDVESIKEN